MKGFTLIEVELSLMVLSLGVLAVVGLYPLGLRESTAAREDVRVVAASESVMSQVVSMLSDTNLSWATWKEIAASGDLSSLPKGEDVLADVPPGWASRLRITACDSARIGIAVKVSPRRAALDSAPLFYSEIRFQGRAR